LLDHQSSFCIVAHKPCSWSAITYASHRSFWPFHTTDLPSTCTCIISLCAFARPYPNSFCNTYVTYAIRLIGSFQTMMIHGRSGSATLSVSGVSSLTGAVMVSARIVLDRQHSVLSPRPLDRFPFRVRERVRDDLACVGGIDQVVQERPARGDVRTDLRAHRLDHLVALRVALF